MYCIWRLQIKQNDLKALAGSMKKANDEAKADEPKTDASNTAEIDKLKMKYKQVHFPEYYEKECFTKQIKNVQFRGNFNSFVVDAIAEKIIRMGGKL